MKVDYIEHMGTDISVVNAARVSFDKESEWSDVGQTGDVRCESKFLLDKDYKLINYLARENHWSPFAHPQVSIRVKAPIFVARQLAKHQVGFAWNEVSRRYVNDPPEFYMPDTFRVSASNVKQGSGGEHTESEQMKVDFADYHKDVAALYEALIDGAICEEQARMVLPQNTYTSWIWTGSLLGWSRVCKLRLDSHTQAETREVAAMIQDVVQPLFPVSWAALL